jgi:hypothetical protein
LQQKLKRMVTCPCGHKMYARSDEALFDVVRRHVDDKHPEFGYSDQDVRDLISKDAQDAKDG